MFKLNEEEQQYIERENDFANTEANSYLACVYAQLSMGRNASEGLFVPVQDEEF